MTLYEEWKKDGKMIKKEHKDITEEEARKLLGKKSFEKLMRDGFIETSKFFGSVYF